MAKDEIKFMILCPPRTGSTLLIRTIGLYPGIKHGMEIFNPILHGDAPWVTWRKDLFQKLYGEQTSYIRKDVCRLDSSRFDLSILSRYAFEEYNGVKIIYDQLEKDSNVWDHIRSIENLKVIFLRRNVIDSAISFRLAEHTNQWQKWSMNEKMDSPSLRYDPEWFTWFYEYFCEPESFYIDMFKDHKCLTIEYEDMIENWHDVVRKVHLHLGLEPMVCDKTIFKRTEGAQQDLIANYNECWRYHQNTILAPHFRHTIKV